MICNQQANLAIAFPSKKKAGKHRGTEITEIAQCELLWTDLIFWPFLVSEE